MGRALMMVMVLCFAAACSESSDGGSTGAGGQASAGQGGAATGQGGVANGQGGAATGQGGAVTGQGGATTGQGGSSSGGETGAQGGSGPSGTGESFVYDATVGEAQVMGNCTAPASNSPEDVNSPTALGVTRGGDRVNVGCPGSGAVYFEKGGCGVSIVNITKLAAGSFSFTQADDTWDLGCASPNNAASLALIFAKSATLTGTWDPATKQLSGTFSGTWEDGGMYKPAGTVTGSFSVTTP